jgi:hypothetical protein
MLLAFFPVCRDPHITLGVTNDGIPSIPRDNALQRPFSSREVQSVLGNRGRVKMSSSMCFTRSGNLFMGAYTARHGVPES